ncbi:MAG: MDR family MFS transporter [Candidatus Promineifilaceae bacterium]
MNILKSSHRWIIILIIILVNLLGSIENSVIQIALPNLAIELGRSYSSLSIIISFYWLAAGAFAFPSGKLGEIYSSGRVFLISIMLFAIAGFGCAFAEHYLIITLFRAIQGISLSSATVNSISLLRQAYPEEQRAKALSIWSSSTSIGYIAGPSLGGLLVQYVGWRIVFGFGGIIVLILFIPVLLSIPNTTSNKNIRFDYSGSLLFSSAIMLFLLILNPISDNGWSNKEMVNIGVFFTITVSLLIYRENRVKEPFIPFSIFQVRQFRKSLVFGIIHSATIQGLIFLLQYDLQTVREYSPSESGLFWMIMSIATLVASLSIGKLNAFYTDKTLVVAGGVFRLLAFASFTILVSMPSLNSILFVVVILVSLFIFGTGMGVTNAPLYSIIIEKFDQGKTSMVSGVYDTFRYVSNSMGVVLFSQMFQISQSSLKKQALILFPSFLVGTIMIAFSLWLIQSFNKDNKE